MGYHDFPSKFFCLTVPKNFVGDPVFVPQSFRYRKNLWIRGTVGVSGFSVDTFLSHKAEKFHRGNSLCFTEFLVSKKLMEKRGLVSGFPVENFLSHGAEKFLWGTLLCFTIFRVSKKIKDKRGVAITILRRKRFSLTMPKNCVGEPFNVPLFLVSTNFIFRMVVSRFSVENFFVAHWRKIS